MQKYRVISDCKVLVHDSQSGTEKTFNRGDIIECLFVCHPKRAICGQLCEDTTFLHVQFEDGQFAIFNSGDLQEIVYSTKLT